MVWVQLQIGVRRVSKLAEKSIKVFNLKNRSKTEEKGTEI